MAKSWEGVTFLTIFRDEKRRWLRLDVASSSSMAFSNDDGERVLFVSPPPNKASFAAENILLLLLAFSAFPPDDDGRDASLRASVIDTNRATFVKNAFVSVVPKDATSSRCLRRRR